MKFLICLGLLATCAHAVAAPNVQVCGALREQRGDLCISDFKPHELPGGTLYGITQQAAGEAPAKYEHRWNGGPPDKLLRFNGGRTLVSVLKGGAGEGKSVEFEVRGPGGEKIAERSFDVRWQKGRMYAQEMDPNEPLAPEAVAEPEKPAPAKMPTVTEAPRAEEGGSLQGFALRRGELHAAYQWSRSGPGSVSAIPYWNPEYRWREHLGVGARLGGTFWDDGNDESFPALEADLHLTIPLTLGTQAISLQPALGLHWWSGAGLAASPGLVADWRPGRLPFSVVASVHVWSQRGEGQRLITLGLAREL